jgi:LemA protein
MATAPTLALSRRWFTIALVPLMLLLGSCGINTIPTLEERADAAWAEVLNQYQRRADLVPNLVETVRGYAQHEREVLEAVTEARSRVGQTQLPADITEDPEAFRRFQENQQALTGALSRLIAVAEAYPDLKANTTFLEFQQALQTVEDEIQMSRRYYNGAARNLNIAVESFPSTVVANAFKFEKAEFFEIENAADRAVPTVKF